MISIKYDKLTPETKAALKFLELVQVYKPTDKESFINVLKNLKFKNVHISRNSKDIKVKEAAKQNVAELEETIKFVTEMTYIINDN
jgi:hypothetical protein